ncbi:hypothetical protein HGRIS_008673 [Hohenbuehelia grisea]|uniref:RNA-dependent RNA polymerase n=1 Tax=Hohenbuehelia grisea TaxID=104357 RepID=A0ABR3J988_9AGAR
MKAVDQLDEDNAMDVDNVEGDVVISDSDADDAGPEYPPARPKPAAPAHVHQPSLASTSTSAFTSSSSSSVLTSVSSATATRRMAMPPPPMSVSAGVGRRAPPGVVAEASMASVTTVDTRPPTPLFGDGGMMSSMSSIGSGVLATSIPSARLPSGNNVDALRAAVEPKRTPLSLGYQSVLPLPKLSAIFQTPADDLTGALVVAHNKMAQALMDEHQIAWGVQYEIARGSFQGNNEKVAGQVRSLMLTRQPKNSENAIWREYDREQVAIEENQGRGNGLMGEHMGELNWYGGKIQQILRIYIPDSKTPLRDGPAGSTRAATAVQLRICIEKSEMRRSHYFARAFGSRRWLQVRVSETHLKEHFVEIKKFVSRPLVLLGRVFLPFHAKDENSIYYVEVEKDWERVPQAWGGDLFRKTYREILDWHNPMEFNYDQAIAKWSTRNTLGFSDTVPVVEFAEENMYLIDDLYSTTYVPGTKAEADQIMTDGCGFINVSAMTLLARTMGYDSTPSAVQGRVAGAKGVWILHPYDHDMKSPPKIWIRKSQNKINLKGLDRAHRIFNLCGPARHAGRCSLSLQSILNLSHNGAPNEVFVELLEEGLKEDIAPLFDWSQPERLWYALAKAGNVTASRAQRIMGNNNGRALGLQGRSFEKETVSTAGLNEEETEDDAEAKGGWTGRKEPSGQPTGVFESGLEMLQAGFHPKHCKPLWSSVRSAVKLQVEKAAETPKLPVNQSTTALIVPDPFGELEENEVYFRPSVPFLDPESGLRIWLLDGKIVIGRYPLRLACDAQKVTAVDNPKYSSYVDVLVVSTKGSRSAANFLSGGDYDGDEVFIIWDKRVVNNFHSKPFVPEPAKFKETYFEYKAGATRKVKEYCQSYTWDRTLPLGTRKAPKDNIYDIILLSVSENKFGLYSKFHDNAVWAHGLAHPMSVCLGYIFTTLLDASKTGLRIKDKVFSDHSTKYSGPHMWTDEAREKSYALRRDANLPKEFVISCILRAGKVQRDKFLHEFERLEIAHTSNDADVILPYDQINAYAHEKVSAKDDTVYVRALWQKELALLRTHVQNCLVKWSESFSDPAPATTRNKKGKPLPKPKDDPVQLLATEFSSFPAEIQTLKFCDVKELAASFAYRFKPQFALAMAFREVCTVKAQAASGGIAPSARKFDLAKSISSSLHRALGRQADEEDDV